MLPSQRTEAGLEAIKANEEQHDTFSPFDVLSEEEKKNFAAIIEKLINSLGLEYSKLEVGELGRFQHHRGRYVLLLDMCHSKSCVS